MSTNVGSVPFGGAPISDRHYQATHQVHQPTTSVQGITLDEFLLTELETFSDVLAQQNLALLRATQMKGMVSDPRLCSELKQLIEMTQMALRSFSDQLNERVELAKKPESSKRRFFGRR